MENNVSLAIDDSKMDSFSADIVDLAIGMQAEYLCLSGFLKGEKMAKVARLEEIVQQLF